MLTRKKRGYLDANLDPLMDILTSVVAVMVVIVLFAVISARGKMISKNVTVKVVAPMLRMPPSGSTSKIFLCRHGNIYCFDIAESVRRMTEGIYANDLSTLISKANERAIRDEFFKYKLTGISGKKPIVILTVDLIKDLGESVEDLKKDDSLFVRKLRQCNRDNHWIHFLVDRESFEVFNHAKEIAEKGGFSIGWDPASLSFPYKECLEGCDGAGASGIQIIKGINILR